MMLIPILVTLVGIMFLKDYGRWYNRYDAFGNFVPAALTVAVLLLAGVLWTFYFLDIL